ncbi:glycosyltransferase family 4 protein [Tautonia marina]|uniref:glycosyltransferase family 4 protein n=1 Tax=Tautonia marina TaxID=2653855 RepID=UPI001261144A|nr:glycosyltransferase family 4 protein [Tautonia marina]
MSGLHVAIVDEELPYPPNSGKRIRTFEVVSRLAQQHRISYLCHRNTDPGEGRQAEHAFRDLGIEPIVVDRTVPPKAGARFYARLAANLASPLPYSVASHMSSALHAAVLGLNARERIDLWQAEWTPYAKHLIDANVAPRLIMAHNIESQIWKRYFEHERNSLRKGYIGHQWRKFERFERRAFAHADQVVTVSEADARIARDLTEVARVDVVDNGVDVRRHQPPPGTTRLPDQVLFLGSLDWRPNLDAIDQLLEVIWPTIRAARSDARLCIVGRNPSQDLRRRISATPGAALHADVPDVRPFLWQSAVMIVPLRIGGGSRLKILEAFAAGLPVVSTQIGAEGLCARAGSEYFGADSVAELAGATLAALGDPARARDLADRARQLVHQRYDWAGLAERLERIWIETADPSCATHRTPSLAPMIS